jgi:hypothetical protein
MVVFRDWFRVRVMVMVRVSPVTATTTATASVTATEMLKEDAVSIVADCEIRKGKRDEKTK